MPSNPKGMRQQRAGSSTRGGAMPSNPKGMRQQRAGSSTRGANVPSNPKLKQTAKAIVEKYKGGQRSKNNAISPSAKKDRSKVSDIIKRFAQEAYDSIIDYRRKKGNKN
jgi:hypothetical protein